MAAPGIPQNFIIQQGNSQVLLSWDLQAGATSYKVYRSTDGLVFSLLASPTTITYLDVAVTQGTRYYYYILSNNVDGDSPATATLNIIPVASGLMTLDQLRLQAQQRADRAGSKFVGIPEWNTYINQAAFELYDLLTTLYEDYYVTSPLSFVTVGSTSQYLLTTIAPNFYKLIGVDLGLANSTSNIAVNSTNLIIGSQYVISSVGTSLPADWQAIGLQVGITPTVGLTFIAIAVGFGTGTGQVQLTANSGAFITLRKYEFISRNRYVYPQLTSYLGVFNLRYRLVGSTLTFIPAPSAGQVVRIWYIPRMVQLLQDTDILDGMNGWDEYVIVRAAKYALDKEESDTSKLDQQIGFLKQRIEQSAMNRDAGQPDTISDVRRYSGYSGYGGPGGDGPYGGY